MLIRVQSLLRGTSNVKFLALSSDIVQLLCVVHEHNLPRFINLANLAFGVGFDFCWIRLVIEFIKGSANLEVLTLHNKGLLRDIDEVSKTPPQPVPECLVNRLRGILIKELYAAFTPDAVEYLVSEINILKRLKVNCQCPIMLRTQIDCTL
uniref:FBD domain-containing protein n=1 Tax=Opuntia streptacantha TaxID=393608 RepID=A0A7C9A3R3_OPUST